MLRAVPKQIEPSSRPAPVPIYILRGHAAAVQTLLFFRSNLRLLSADSDGWIVIWSLTSKRAVAVWRGHAASVLAASVWHSEDSKEFLVTHGRDQRLCVWDFQEDGMSTLLPVDESGVEDTRKMPWVRHVLNIGGVGFCGMGCVEAVESRENHAAEGSEMGSVAASRLVVAVPTSSDGDIALYELPSEKQVAGIPAPDSSLGKTGMLMAVNVFNSLPTDDATTEIATVELESSGRAALPTKPPTQVPADDMSTASEATTPICNSSTTRSSQAQSSLTVIAAYESGRVHVFQQRGASWSSIYTSCPHSQPILSLSMTPDHSRFFTCGADATLAQHPLPSPDPNSSTGTQSKEKSTNTKHAGQQSLRARDDGRIFATAGWDGRGRVYSSKTMKELAVLKWHKEGCYAVAFADVLLDTVGSDANGVLSGDRRLVESIVEQTRSRKAQETHWMALGSKDGKISLWDIY